MIELAFVLQELQRLKEKEKSIRLRNHLQNAIDNIKDYEKMKKDA
ncbi:MAG: hypothetical protein V1847_00145 [Candidatus Diapherotrites archaeon]